MAASASFSNPYRPSFPGEEAFTRELSHVSDYRNPMPHAGRRVVTDSGGFEQTLAEGRVDRRPMFNALDGGRVDWSDGQHEPVDAIILATGYRPSLHYLRGLRPRPAGVTNAPGGAPRCGQFASEPANICQAKIDLAERLRTRYAFSP